MAKHNKLTGYLTKTHAKALSSRTVSAAFAASFALLLLYAKVSCAQGQALDPSKQEGCEKYNHAIQLHNEGVIFFQRKDYLGAQRKFKEAVELNPNFAEAHCNLGNALMNTGQYETALSEFVKATDISPNLSVAWEDLGTCYQTLGRTPEAVAAYKKYLSMDPKGQHASKIKSTTALLENEIKRTSSNPVTNGPSDYIGDATQNGMTRWRASDMPLKIFIRSGARVTNYQAVFETIVRKAFEDWGGSSNGLVSFDFVDSESKANIICSWTDNPREMMSSAEGGHAMVIPDDHNITKAIITLLTVNPSGGLVSPTYAKRVDLHEIGHALGILGHSKNPSDIMFSSLPPADLEPVLSERDKGTLIALYSADASKFSNQAINVSRLMMSGDPASTLVRIVKLNAEASQAMNNKNFSLAVAKLEEAHRLDPNNDLITGNLGSAFANCAAMSMMLRNFPQAERYFAESIPLLAKSSNKGNYLAVLQNYSTLLRNLNRYAEADKVSKRIKSLESSN